MSHINLFNDGGKMDYNFESKPVLIARSKPDIDSFTKAFEEAYTYNKNRRELISDINIIVPNKVLEVTFMDGLKEKMVCNVEDTYNLRNCLFIAISKHLYKKEYTQEGIEWKAFELSYLKKYVQIVDKALKSYNKKCNDIEKLEFNRKVELKRIEKRAAKRIAYQKRREEKQKLEKIKIQKEAYIQAMEYTNKNNC